MPLPSSINATHPQIVDKYDKAGVSTQEYAGRVLRVAADRYLTAAEEFQADGERDASARCAAQSRRYHDYALRNDQRSEEQVHASIAQRALDTGADTDPDNSREFWLIRK